MNTFLGSISKLIILLIFILEWCTFYPGEVIGGRKGIKTGWSVDEKECSLLIEVWFKEWAPTGAKYRISDGRCYVEFGKELDWAMSGDPYRACLFDSGNMFSCYRRHIKLGQCKIVSNRKSINCYLHFFYRMISTEILSNPECTCPSNLNS